DPYDVVTEDTFTANINPDDPTQLDNNNYKARSITVFTTPPADLTVTSVSADSQAVGGDSFHVAWTVKNVGSVETKESNWFDTVYLSDTPTLSNDLFSRLLLGSVAHEGILGSGQDYTAEATFALNPLVKGKYAIVVTGPINEGPYTDNNARSAPTNV